MRRLWRLGTIGVLALLHTSACSQYSQTVRIVDGEEVSGRPISASAYTAYLVGAKLEAAGEPRLALDAYREAFSQDSSSVELQTRIATLICQLSPNDATPEFEDAESLDPTYEGLWREWARCELRRGKLTRALRMAKRSLLAGPNSLAATTTLARVHEARKERPEALRVLVAYVVREPQDWTAWRELYDVARRQRDAVWMLEAGRVLSEHQARRDRIATLGETPDRVVARVLKREGLTPARHAATELGVTVLELGWIALAHQRPQDARSQAELALGANPENLEAAILGLCSSHAAGREAEFSEWLKRVPAGSAFSLSEHAQAALLELLETRAGSDAAQMLQRAFESPSNATPHLAQ